MNSVLEKIYETSHVEDAQSNLINPFPTATSQETGTILSELIQKHDCQKTLEIGCAYGLSTLFMCQTHENRGAGNHTAIDPGQSSLWKSIGLLNIKRAKLEDRFQFFEAPSYETLPKLLADRECFDLAFIDGSHFFDYTLVDFFYIDKLLSVGKYVVFDDIWMPSIRKVVYYLLRNRKYELVKIDKPVSFKNYALRVGYRFVQNIFEIDYGGIRWIPHNICLLKKIDEDRRDWKFHRLF
jgi:predicted O-methyltransferase YrrM